MSRALALNGSDWQFKDFYGEDWRWRDAHKPGSRDVLHWRAGHVPGSVQDDLWRLGEVPNPYYERNSLLLEWVPARTWVYKKTCAVPDALRGKRLRLHFDGVDYEAAFYLNGELLGGHRGLFTPAVFDVTERVQFGAENLIAVVIAAAPHEQPQVSRTSLVRTDKPRMNYWWDFCPRMINIGIWQDVWLEATETARLEDVWVRPTLTDDFQRAEVAVRVDVDAAQAASAAIEVTLRLSGETVTTGQLNADLSAGKNTLKFSLPVEQPRLWYPNGHGQQPLYDADVRVLVGGQVSDERSVRFGIRNIELVANEGAEAGALPYTFVVNGAKIYAKGWNWVPIDALYGVPRPEKLDHLLRLAQRAHVNLLRVWGGGLIETEAFYERCDALGIMVWQEFTQSSSGISNLPPETPEYIEMMVREAEVFIPRKRNHPSLAIWCGGNELTTDETVPLDDTHPTLAALKAVVQRLDPDRLWLPTSPSGRVFSNSLENIVADPLALHDVHGPWEYQGVTGQYELYNAGTSLIHTEFGVEGITNRKALNATIAPEHQAPATLENPLWQHLGAWWVKQRVWQATFGEIADVETLQKATQYMQAEGLRYALEADRRRQYHNSGTLPWQFNEPYPMAACTSAIDYYGQAKPSYYGVARAYEPLHLSAKFPTAAWAGRETFGADVWISNSYEGRFSELNLTARLVGASGRVYTEQKEAVTFEANGSTQLAALHFALADLDEAVFLLDLLIDSDEASARNRYAFTKGANFAPLLALPATQIKMETAASGDAWHIKLTNVGGTAALTVWLEDSRPVSAAGYVYFDDNAFSLLPGETRTIAARWVDVPYAEQNVQVSGWNVQQAD